MNRDELFLQIFGAYLSNNELRSDMNSGKAISKELPAVAIARMFDVADVVMAEAEKRREEPAAHVHTLTYHIGSDALVCACGYNKPA